MRDGTLKLPDFIGVGPGRTGSTWLNAALRQVAWMPDGVKETVFFKHRYHKGIEWYAWHFRHADDSRPIGEVCPYFRYEVAMERIATHLPQCKIICTFRDPAERAYSYYRVRKRSVRLHGSFADALTSDPGITESSRYAFYLRKWQERFGKDRVLVSLYDDLTADPQRYLDRICDFIGAAHISLQHCEIEPPARNSVERAPRFRAPAWLLSRTLSALNSYHANTLAQSLRHSAAWSFLVDGGEPYPPLAPEAAALARAQFRPEVEQLEQMLGRDLAAWK